MSVRIRLMTCGWLECDRALIVEGASGRISLPIPSVLVEHPRGLALFDSGLHPSLPEHPERIGTNQRLFAIRMKKGEDVGVRLAAIGVDPGEIRYLVNSHLHFDHCGGNERIPNATLVVQKPEWAAGHLTKMIERDVYNPADFDLGHPVMEIEGEHDLFEDGSVRLVPTYGHTPGHQSLVVHTDEGEIVFAADTCYLRETLEQGRLPPFGYNLDWQRRSLEWLRERRGEGARIVFGHDPEQWPELPEAPEALSPVAVP